MTSRRASLFSHHEGSPRLLERRFDLIAPALFCNIETFVCQVDQFCTLVCILGINRDSHTHGWNRNGDLAVAANLEKCHARADTFGNLYGLCQIGIWQGNREFFPTPASDRIGLFDMFADDVAQASENLISDQMTESIVVLFEVINIEHDQAEGLV